MKSKPGRGTSMIVVFPARTCPEVPILTADKRACAVTRNVKNKHCLIVDDVPENTYTLQCLLQSAGLKVTVRNRASQALEFYSETCLPGAPEEQKRPEGLDLVITDLRMPEMSGQQLIIDIRRIERENELRKVPIVVLTGETSPAEKVACLSQYGADEYLLKPIKFQDLLSSVERVLVQQALSRQMGKNIMLVDDDVISQSLLSNVIRQAGCVPHRFFTVAEAKRGLAEDPDRYDLILLDSELPDGTGVDFMIFYRDTMRGRRKQAPVASMSGNEVAAQEQAYKGFENMCGFFQKPVSKANLFDVIKSLR